MLDDLVDGAADAPPAPAAAVPQGEDGGGRTQPTTLLLMLNSWWQRFTVIKVLEGFCFWLNFVQYNVVNGTNKYVKLNPSRI